MNTRIYAQRLILIAALGVACSAHAQLLGRGGPVGGMLGGHGMVGGQLQGVNTITGRASYIDNHRSAQGEANGNSSGNASLLGSATGGKLPLAADGHAVSKAAGDSSGEAAPSEQPSLFSRMFGSKPATPATPATPAVPGTAATSTTPAVPATPATPASPATPPAKPAHQVAGKGKARAGVTLDTQGAAQGSGTQGN